MARPIETELTARQTEIVVAIHQIGQGGGVLISDLVKNLHAARETSLVPTLERIARIGYIEIMGGGQRGKPRLLELTDRAKAHLGVRPGTPLLGMVAAGAPGGCVFEETEFIQCSIHPNGEKYSYTIVRGDSMDREGVLDGDHVLLERLDRARSGQIVAAQITRNGACEFGLKYFFRNSQTGTIALCPNSNNRAHRVCLLADECSAADLAWLRKTTAGKRPVSSRRDVEVIAVEDVSTRWLWKGGLIRPMQK